MALDRIGWRSLHALSGVNEKKCYFLFLRDVLTDASSDASVVCALFKQQKYPSSRFNSLKKLNGVPEVGVLEKEGTSASAIASARGATR